MNYYTEKMRANDEYPKVGEKVIMNLLVEVDGLKKYNGCELLLVEHKSKCAPLFYCIEHDFSIMLNNSHFRAMPTKEKPNVFTPAYQPKHIDCMCSKCGGKCCLGFCDKDKTDDWQIGDAVAWGDLTHSGVIKSLSDGFAWIKRDNGSYDTIYVTSLKKPKTESEKLTADIETMIHNQLSCSNFTGDLALGDIASIICSELEVNFKVSKS